MVKYIKTMMHSFSDAFLSNIDETFQWIAIIGTAAGLLSMLGLMFVGDEINRRQEERIIGTRSLAEETSVKFQARSITTEERNKILGALSDVKKTDGIINIMTCIQGDSDQYGRELWRVLNDSGIPLTYGLCIAEFPDGVTLNPKDDPTPSLAKPVFDALNNAGIKVLIYDAPKEFRSDKGIDLMIGRKPVK